MSVIHDVPSYTGIGIYALIDDYGKMYIGSSRNIHTRIKAHERAMKRGTASKKIQAAISEGRSFRCEILEKMDYGASTYDLRERELHHIRQNNSDHDGYNSARFWHSGREQTAEVVRYYESLEPSGMSGYTKKLYNKLSEPIQPPDASMKIVQARVPIDLLEAVRIHAEAQGESLNGFIIRAMSETMERDTAAE